MSFSYKTIKGYLIYLSIIGGILFGYFYPKTSLVFFDWSMLYISFIQMTIIPIVITSIISNINHFFSQKISFKILVRLIVYGLLAFAFIGVFTASLCLIAQPGKNIAPASRMEMGKFISKIEGPNVVFGVEKEISKTTESTKTDKGAFFSLLLNIIPSNIFDALDNGHFLKIVFFSYIFGIALLFIPRKESYNLSSIAEAIYKSFQKILQWQISIIPIVLFFLYAGNIATLGSSLIFGLGYFIIIFYSGVLFLVLINTIILSIKCKMSFFKVLASIKETLLLVLGVKNVFIALPFAIRALRQDLKLDKNVLTIIPITFTLFGFGYLFIFGFAIIFFAQLYYVSFTFTSFLFVILATILLAIATTGAPVTVNFSILYLACHYLDLPLNPLVILLYAIDPILSPFYSTLSVSTNCTLTALLCGKEKESSKDSSTLAKISAD